MVPILKDDDARESSRNVAGSPVYYPPGHEMFEKKEEAAVWKASVSSNFSQIETKFSDKTPLIPGWLRSRTRRIRIQSRSKTEKQEQEWSRCCPCLSPPLLRHALFNHVTFNIAQNLWFITLHWNDGKLSNTNVK